MSQPSFLDRAFQRVKPAPVAGYAPPPRELAPGLWLLERRLRMPPAMTLPINTTIVRLASGGVVVFSPPERDPGAHRPRLPHANDRRLVDPSRLAPRRRAAPLRAEPHRADDPAPRPDSRPPSSRAHRSLGLPADRRRPRRAVGDRRG